MGVTRADMMKAAGEVRFFLALVVLAGLWTAVQLYYSPGQEPTTERTPGLLKQRSMVKTRLRDKPLVFYNRVPKCGSNSMKILLRTMAKNNYFSFLEDKVYVIETFEDNELTFDECVLSNAWECDAEGQESFLMTKFFCGHDPICRQPSQAAVEKAKDNIRRHYAVVGVLEEFSSFLKVLEVVMPQFFRGAHDTWKELTQQTKLLEEQRTVNRSPPSPRSQKIMRERLKLDYQVYYFIRERFHRQKTQLGIKD